MRSFDELLNYSKGNNSVFQSLRDMMKESYRTGDFKIVPFIGSGLTAFVYPTWTKALQELASELGDPPEFTQEMEKVSPDLEVAAEILWNVGGNRIGSILRDKVFGLNKLEGQNLRRQVVNILPAMFPKSLLITTNFDKTIENVFPNIGKRIETVYPEANSNFLNDISSQNDRCCLFKIHGDIYDNPDRIVFPKENYERVYQAESPLVISLGRLFQQRSMFFLGASLLADRTLDLLSLIRNAGSTTEHLAILQCSDNETKQDNRRNFLGEYGIQAIFYPSGEHESISVILEHLFEEVNPTGFEVFFPKLGTKRDVSNRFDWRSEFTTFAGREEELKRLQDFLDNKESTAKSERVTWWAVTGPGGMGKSRLVNQFLLNLAPGWHACQFTNHQEITQAIIQEKVNNVSDNVLIVADYVQNLSDQFSAWIQAIAYESSQKQVRILLLQRENYTASRRDDTDQKGLGAVSPKPPWLQNMVNTFPNIMNFAYQEESLELGAFSENILKEIMYSYKGSLNPDDQVVKKLDDQSCDQLIQRLKELDPDFLRPLFAMFLADAYLRGKDPTKWDQEAVLSHFTNRELGRQYNNLKSLFSQSSKSPKHADYRTLDIILSLATILGGHHLDTQSVRLEPYDNLKSVLCPLSAPKYFFESLAACGLAEEVVDKAGPHFRIPGIKPDLLGEYLVNRHFQEADPDRSELLPLLRSESEKFTNQSRIWDFFVRFVSHYLLDESWLNAFATLEPARYGIMAGLINQAEAGRSPEVLYQMANALLEADTEDSLLHTLFSVLLSTLTYARDNLSEVTEAVNKLQSLQIRFPDSHKIADAFAKGLFDLTFKQEKSHDISETVDRLEALHNSFPDSPDIVRAIAWGLVRLTTQQSAHDIFGTVARLEKLYSAFTDSQEIARAFSMALIILALKQQKAQETSDTVGRLEALHNSFPDSQEIAIELARGLFSLTNKQPTAKDIYGTVAQLEALYSSFPDSQEIALRLTRGLVNLTARQETAQDISDTVGRLEALHNSFSGSHDIASELARGLFILTNKQETAEDRRDTVGRLEAIHNRFPDSQEIAIVFARGLVSLSVKQQTKRDISGTIGRLEALQNSFPGSHEIVFPFAMVLASMTAKQRTAREISGTIGRLEALYSSFHTSQEIALAFAKGLVNLAVKQRSVREISGTIGQLEALYSSFPASQEIALAFAKGLVNLAVKQRSVQATSDTVGQLEALHKRFTDSLKVAVAFAEGLNSLYDKTTDPVMKEKIKRKIQELKRRFPGEDGFDLLKLD